MLSRYGQLLSRIGAPLACAVMLGVVVAGERDNLRPADFDRYHADVRQAVIRIPDEVGPWRGREEAVPESAIALLRPNALRNIRFSYQGVEPNRVAASKVSLTIVQCRRAQDMLGHYPPNCYPAFGNRLVGQRDRTWDVRTPDGASRSVGGIEYAFEGNVGGTPVSWRVYNFMLVPTKGIVRDMKSLVEATEDYRQRYYGAAQVQVVFVSLAGQEAPEADRDEVASRLIAAAWPAIEVTVGGVVPAGAPASSANAPASSAGAATSSARLDPADAITSAPVSTSTPVSPENPPPPAPSRSSGVQS